VNRKQDEDEEEGDKEGEAVLWASDYSLITVS